VGIAQQGNESVVLGRIMPMPDDLADTAHLSILNFAAKESGVIKSVTLHLGQEPPGDGKHWEVLVYKMVGGHRFQLEGKRRIQIDPLCRRPQQITLLPPLPIEKGGYVGLVNRDGKLRLTYTRGWEQEVATWDLWYQESQPPGDIGSSTAPLLMWNGVCLRFSWPEISSSLSLLCLSFLSFAGSVGWFANMQPDEPEPAIVVAAPTLTTDMLSLLDDKETSDIVFFVGISQEPVHCHRAILIARSSYFRALLKGGFRENGAHELFLPELAPCVFKALLEFLYTSSLPRNLNPDAVVELLRAASRYCLPRLLAQCEQRLRESITSKNSIDMLKLCQSCHAMQLEAVCSHRLKKRA